MKKLLPLALGLVLLGLNAVNAEEKKKDGEAKRPEMTAEQKKLWKEMVTKYDADKSGRLNKEEKTKISDEDKKKLKDAGIGPKDGEKKDKKHEKHDKK